jgi:predicted acylesterase/phospholipase RssA
MTTILYVGGRDARGDALGLMERSDVRRNWDGSFLEVRRGTPPFVAERKFVQIAEPEAAIEFLRSHAVDVLILDTRAGTFRAGASTPSEGGAFQRSRAGRVLEAIFPNDAFSGPVLRERIVGIVGDGASGAASAYWLGRYQVGAILSSPTIDSLFAHLDRMLPTTRGRFAICLAGGGIEGLFYELGVLRALESFMADRSIVDADFFCGISAGAVLGAFLANGLGPDEIVRGLTGESARIGPIGRFQLFDPNVKEVGSRAFRLARELVRGGVGPRGVASSLARSLPSAMFSGNGIRGWLERELGRPGMTNSFRELRRPLYVGATDQDTSEAVVFGKEPFQDVPIHKAVRASAALIPFYAPENIDGRYYIDGAFSRTTNMRVAVEHGATLVILVDPLVPTHGSDAGYVQARGGLFATMQGLKALINGRFDKAQRAIREMYPEVAFYLFRPEGDEMRMLSGSPMKYFYRKEIVDVAYENTVQKLKEHLPELTRDFGRHGITVRDPTEPMIASPPPTLEPESLGVDR